MQRLHRARQRQEFVPVAAEVLEVRDLLSSGAAAVHGAAHHAAIQQAAHPASEIAPLSAFHGTLNGGFKINNGPANGVHGPVSLSNIRVIDLGAPVSGHFSFSSAGGGTKIKLKGSFSGTMTNIQTTSDAKEIQLTPTGGSLTYSQKTGHTFISKVQAIPDGSPLALTLTLTNKFVTVFLTDTVQPGGIGLVGGDTIQVAVGL